ncbi:MAG: tRNA (adenosine(37)-N6)-threonylcarbamoyltransferase complex dimerization subunit type 1 TsaB [bacterium]
MKIISIETSGPVCAVALSDNDTIVSEYSSSDGNPHDAYCAEYVRKVLEDNSLGIENIDAVAISSGPGSFTGLRIGASIAKALCFKESDEDYAPKLISVPTLSAFANNVAFCHSERSEESISKIIAVIPAQKDVLYYQEFTIHHTELVEGQKKLGSRLSVLGYRFKEGEINICNIEDFKKFDFKDTLVCGPASYIINPEPALPSLNEYSAEKIAKLAIKKYKLVEFTDPNDFKPIYVQDFVVKTKKK